MSVALCVNFVLGYEVANAYVSTVPNPAGQYRFLLPCPAVLLSTSLVPNLFAVAASLFLRGAIHTFRLPYETRACPTVS